MKPWELFERLRRLDYTETGRHLRYAFLVDDESKTVYVCFQETDGAGPWRDNLNFFSKAVEPYRGCGWEVHRGHKRVWRSDNETVMAKVQGIQERLKKEGKDYEIKFAGFSKGASIALLGAEDWAWRTNKRSKVVQFGGAMVGKGTGFLNRMAVAVETVHFVHRNDIVTRLPPFPGWSHVNVLHILGNRFLNPFKLLFRANKYHQSYGDQSLYSHLDLERTA